MEVHHPHHPGHKKKWTEYLLEFLMLFLAVFLGFTAENIREHKIERHRETDYIKGLVQNLKDDTTNLQKVIPQLTRKIEKIDSIVKMSKADLSEPGNLKLLTRLSWHAATYSYFKSNTATMAQLKAGNLRLIRHGHAADSILKYDLLNEYSEKQWNVFFSLFQAYIETSEDVFDVTIMLDSSYQSGVISGKFPPPVTADKEKLRVYFNRAVAVYISSRGYEKELTSQLDFAVRLIAYLKKVYDLDE